MSTENFPSNSPMEDPFSNSDQSSAPVVEQSTCSKIAAGLLAIFLGALGAHNFYLGKTKIAIVQLLIGTIGWILIFPPIVLGIWTLVEGILILTSQPGSKWHQDGAGRELRD